MLQQFVVALLSNPLGLAAAATPFVLNHLNNEKAKLAAEAAHRASELQRANQIFNDVSVTMDRLAYLSKQVMYGIVFRKLNSQGGGEPADIETFKAYQGELTKWESTKATNSAQMFMYFGKENAEAFKRLQDDFEELENQVSAGFFQRTTSRSFIEDKKDSPNDFRTKYFNVWDRVLKEMTALSVQMIYAIQNEEVGSLRPDQELPPPSEYESQT